MGTPTHVQVIVKRSRNLKIKGKDGTNDAFVIIGLGKEKFRTSVIEKTTKTVEWMEECELLIPRQGNTAELVLKVMHQGNLKSHQFLGMVNIPLKDLQDDDAITDNIRPMTKWYLLKSKPNQNKSDYRGDLEVTISFLEKQLPPKPDRASSYLNVNDKSGKNSGSLQSLNKFTNKIGGSLISLGHNEKRLWKKKNRDSTNSLPRNISAASKLSGSVISVTSSCFSDSLENLGGGEVLRKTLNPSLIPKDAISITSSTSNGSTTNLPNNKQPLDQVKEEDDIDDDEWNVKLSSVEEDNLNIPKRKVSSVIKDFIVNNTSNKHVNEKKIVSSDINIKKEARDKKKKISFHNNDIYPLESYVTVSNNGNREPSKSSVVEESEKNITKNKDFGEVDATTHKISNLSRGQDEIPPPKPPRIVIGRELSKIESEGCTSKGNGLSGEEKRVFLNSFNDKSREDLIEILVSLQRKLETDNKKINDLEEYTASLLLKVITNAPEILDAGLINPSIEESRNDFLKLHRNSL
jgi:Rab11 family-interacting protein 1/2/5